MVSFLPSQWQSTDSIGWGQQPTHADATGTGAGNMGDNSKSQNGDSQNGNGDAEPKSKMLDDRMSEGTGLISNDFQVEVS